MNLQESLSIDLHHPHNLSAIDNTMVMEEQEIGTH